MAAKDGTNAGSSPDGVGVGTGVGVGVGESLADGAGDVVGEEDALGVAAGGLTAAVGVQPAMTRPMAMTGQAWAIRPE